MLCFYWCCYIQSMLKKNQNSLKNDETSKKIFLEKKDKNHLLKVIHYIF